jgi:HK97 family phage major capsid protein
MQISQLANKVDALSRTWEHFKSTNDEKLRQIEKKGYADPLTEQTLSRINQSFNECKFRLDGIETSMQRPGGSSVFNSDEGHNEHKSAFIDYVKKGRESGLLDIEKKSLSATNDSDGGFLVEKQISKQIVQRITASSSMRQLASIEEISSDLLDILEDTDTTDAGWVTETESRKETKSPTFNKKFIRVHEIYAQPHATQKLIDDARIDIEKWITEKIADKFAAVENHAFIYGDGKNKPAGILSCNDIKTVNVSELQTITADNILDLYYSLRSEYAAKGTFLMHRNTLQLIRGLKCPTTGHYLWSPGLALKAPDTLLGAPIMECSDMPLPEKGNCPIAFADFKTAYKIVDRTGIRMLRDPFTDKPFIKFYATKRVGGDVINPNAIKLLKLSKDK